MITVSNITKRYPGFMLEASLEVKPGYITGLIGKNGAGKSTLFKSILGLVKPESGSIFLLGKDSRKITDKDRQRIGAVLSDSGFSGYLTIEDIQAILKGFYPGFREDWFVRKCEEFRLDKRKRVKEYSTGMKAKLNILCGLSHDAEILVLDEPTAGLDVLARDEVLEMLREYMEEDSGRSILISSHISTDLEALCDDLYMIDEGKIILHEDTDVLMDTYALIKVPEDIYESMDKSYFLKKRRESYGYSVLTNQSQFYRENYPNLVIEKSGIDHLMGLMIGGEMI